jgi:hypothetical protein
MLQQSMHGLNFPSEQEEDGECSENDGDVVGSCGARGVSNPSRRGRRRRQRPEQASSSADAVAAMSRRAAASRCGGRAASRCGRRGGELVRERTAGS